MTKQEHNGFIDFPRKEFNTIWGSTFLCLGWAISESPITNLLLRIDGTNVAKLARDVPRPDVIRAHPAFVGQENCGFYGQASAQGFGKGRHEMSVLAETREATFTIGPVEFEFDPEFFLKKSERILEVLRCPSCSGRFTRQPRTLICTLCQQTIPLIYDTPFFIDKPETAITPKTTPSSPYNDTATRIIKENEKGLVLDCGAGYQVHQYENVIQVDMEKYPSTDCVLDVLKLPFPDECFDGVISQSVVEHVNDPFAYVTEMERVLKKGGYIIADAGFLQPLHAYPHHYFNTSISGLRRLFRSFELVESGVAGYQLPWYTIRWILNSYLDAISDPGQREAFLSSTIRDAMKTLNDNPNKYPFNPVKPESVEQLACGVYFYGRKR